MSEKLITPKYLTRNVCRMAVSAAHNLACGISSPIRPLLNREHFHIVVLVPAMVDAREEDYPDYPVYPTKAYIMYEKSFGEKSDWEHSYDDIAKCLALQLWTDRNDERACNIPHLLFPGDTPYWGGVKRSGIVVACSGVQPWFNKMISGVTADGIIALAHAKSVEDAEAGIEDFLK